MTWHHVYLEKETSIHHISSSVKDPGNDLVEPISGRKMSVCYQQNNICSKMLDILYHIDAAYVRPVTNQFVFSQTTRCNTSKHAS